MVYSRNRRRRTYRRRTTRRPTIRRRRYRIGKRRRLIRRKSGLPRANSSRRMYISRNINFLGDSALAHFKDIQYRTLSLGSLSLLPPSNNNYIGDTIGGNYLTDTYIPDLALFQQRFTRCRITRSTVVCEFYNFSPTRYKQCGLTLLSPRTQDPAATWSSQRTPGEQPNTSVKTITPRDGSRSMCKVVGTATTFKAFGVKVDPESTELSASSPFSEPTNYYKWYFWQGDGSGADTTNEGVRVKIASYWTVLFYERYPETI